MPTAQGPIELANRLRGEGRFADAIAVLQSALAARKNFLEAHFNLAILLQQTGNFSGAEREYRAALRLKPTLVEAMQGLAGVLLETGRSEEALPLLRRVLAEKGPSALIEYALGRALGMENRLEEALTHNQRARSLNPGATMAYIHRGELLEQLGRNEEAITLYQDILMREPGNIDAHARLNALLYRLKRDDVFLRSFDAATARSVHPAALLVAKANFLMRADRAAEAEECFSRALVLEPKNIAAAMGRAAALSGQSNSDAAIHAFEQAIALQPDDVNVLNGFAATLLQAREAGRAEKSAKRALALRPHDQTALALLGLSWRAQADGRDEQRNDYRDFVRVYDLEPPKGFADTATFHAELQDELQKLYRDDREHIDQTLRGGTRAATSKLFGAGYRLVEMLRTRIDEALKRYIGEMACGEDHPFLARRGRSFTYSGSWSSRLSDCGFHLNHIHPAGWISSAYYVEVPDRQPADPAGGHLKFGEPPWDIGLADPVRRIVEPVPGRLVLFPSYLWHGTIPFHGPKSRTTIAFDVLPLNYG
ncbi:MAG: tetratricopeptide repeat protein [Pseudomonadota bacterium]